MCSSDLALHDVPRDWQAEPAAPALGREIRIEHVLQMCAVDAQARIPDSDDNRPALSAGCERDALRLLTVDGMTCVMAASGLVTVRATVKLSSVPRRIATTAVTASSV